MRDIKAQISNLMTKLDHESKTLLSSFSVLQPENEADMTVHSLANFLPPQKKVTADKENDYEAKVVDENNYLTLGDLQKVEPPVTEPYTRIAENCSSLKKSVAKSLSKSPEKKAIRSSSRSLGRRN